MLAPPHDVADFLRHAILGVFAGLDSKPVRGFCEKVRVGSPPCCWRTCRWRARCQTRGWPAPSARGGARRRRTSAQKPAGGAPPPPPAEKGGGARGSQSPPKSGSSALTLKGNGTALAKEAPARGAPDETRTMAAWRPCGPAAPPGRGPGRPGPMAPRRARA